MRSIFLAIGLCLGVVLLGGCNDDINLVGPSIQPDSDKMAVYTDTFQISTATVLIDSIYARTQAATLGEIYDRQFGYLKSDYLCQLRSPQNFAFKYTPVDGQIDSIYLQLFYSTWVGDSLAPMRLQVYAVSQPLERNYYTNVNPADFCDMQTVLGTKTYTAFDRGIPDSIRYATDSYTGEYTFYPQIAVHLPRELGQKFYDETINNPSSFADQDAFNRFFPGMYVTNTFGSGNILHIDNSYVYIFYRHEIEGSQGQDSIVPANEIFNVTQEVIQLNRFRNSHLEQMLQPDDHYTYIKAPAGVCTRVTFPVSEIKEKIGARTVNNLPFHLYTMPQGDWDYAFNKPAYLMLLPEDSVVTFFENGQVENLTTSFLGTYSAVTQSYSFGNISSLIRHQIEKNQGNDISMLAIPVTRTTGQDYYGNYYTSAISHYLAPAGVQLRKDESKRRFAVTTTSF